jgi:aerobic-type carbon monoxide dehydrogenase small subunit (CoxS/CutS family)
MSLPPGRSGLWLKGRREQLGLTGLKIGCDLGDCGTRTVFVDSKPILSYRVILFP